MTGPADEAAAVVFPSGDDSSSPGPAKTAGSAYRSEGLPEREPGDARSNAEPLTDILDELFHGCALTAWLMEAARVGGFPESEPTKHLAYRLYEDAIAEKNGRPRPSLRSVDPTSHPEFSPVEPPKC